MDSLCMAYSLTLLLGVAKVMIHYVSLTICFNCDIILGKEKYIVAKKVDKILPRNPEEDPLKFAGRVAKALRLERIEVRRTAEGFAIVVGRELTIDEFVALNGSGLNYRTVLEFDE
ncbi:MAG: hypothetical protein M3M85_03835 [bacterium]|nr:hypothetical protein [bacterium]